MAGSDDDEVRAQLENEVHKPEKSQDERETPKKKKKKRSRESDVDAVEGEKSDRKKKKSAKLQVNNGVVSENDDLEGKKKAKSQTNGGGGVEMAGATQQANSADDFNSDIEQSKEASSPQFQTPKSTHKKKTGKITKSKSTDSGGDVSTADVVNGANEASSLDVHTPQVKDSTKKKRRSTTRKSAKLPDDYKAITNEAGEHRFPCPVDSCQSAYTRRDTVTQHLQSKHHENGELLRDNGDGTLTIITSDQIKSGEILRDNGDGTLTLISSDQNKISDANSINSSDTSDIIPSDRITPALPPPGLRLSPSASSKPDKRPAPRASGTANSKPGKDIANPSTRVVTHTVTTNHEDDQSRKRSKLTNGSPAVRPGSNAIEEWELGAGKFLESDENEANGSGVEDPIAYSGFVINGSKDGVRFPGSISFAIQHIPAGTSHKFKANDAQRICSVSRGKVQVNMDKKLFSIGVDGVFRIKTGAKCEVLNQNYEYSVLHITTI